MGLFDFFSTEIAIDLGTANTLIMYNDEVVVDEPSIVALDRQTGKVLAIGREAQQMHEKVHENIKTVRPLKDGVIADFTVAEHMIRGMIKMIPTEKRWINTSHRMVICIPSGITEVEKRAVKDSAEHAGAKEVFLIHEPMAAAIGIGINVEEPIGNMVVDIGGGTSEIAVIALSGIVCDQSIRVAGDDFNNDILDYMRRQHNLQIGERTAERIKIEVGAAIPDLADPPQDIPVRGKDMMTGIPKTISISYKEVAHALNKSISKIEDAILRALELTPPELSADIFDKGIHLTGGGALLRGLDQRISDKTKLPVHVAKDPLRAVVRGTGIALKNINRFKFILT
jgi:rod shape-determining protein MreB